MGRTEEILLEEEVEIDGIKYMQGYTKRYVKVAVKIDDFSKKMRQNDIVVVQIRGFLDENLLCGKVMIEF